jgi:hypothetical protein
MSRRVVGVVATVVTALALLTGLNGQEPRDAGTWSAAGSLSGAREGAGSVLLADGRVLVFGGHDATGAVMAPEIYAGGAWTAAENLLERWGHTTTTLADGRVLITGGESATGLSAAIDLFDPATGDVTPVGSLSIARKGHAATLLGDGRVLVAGGFDGTSVVGLVELFDPAGGTVTTAPFALTVARAGLTATTLLDGRVLLAGGNDGASDLALVEIVSPAAGPVSVGAMSSPRRDHAAVLLPHNNQVLLVGGWSNGVPAGAELFRSWTGEFVGAAAPAVPRVGATASALAEEGWALVAGGADQASAEKYAFATVKTDQPDYYPGDRVTMSGSGWQPGETVTLLLWEVPLEHPSRTYTAEVQADGAFVNDEMLVEEHHLGVRFYLRAIGSASGTQAQMTFTDSPKLGSVTVGAQSPAPVTAGNSATYTVTVSRGSGSGSAGNFTASLSITTSLPTGAAATFTPNVVSFAPSESSKTSTLTITTTAATLAGNTPFTVRAGTSANDFATGVGSLAVVPPCTSASISQHPVSRTVEYAADASFSAGAGGSPTPTAQWQVSTDGGGSWTDVSGATSDTLTLTKPDVAMSGNRYRVVFTNSCNGTQTARSDAATLTVSPKALTGSFTAAGKEYDGTTAATVLTRDLAGTVDGDSVTLTGGTATFDTEQVGTGKTVTLTGATLTGGDAGNYTLSSVSTATADITPKSVTGSFIAANKVYDGTTDASIVDRLVTGTVAGDTVSLTGGAATFADKNVGTGKTVTASGFSLSGVDAGNYALQAGPWTTTADITQKVLTGSFTAASKIYDGTTDAEVLTRSLAGVVDNDDVALEVTGPAFPDKHVGMDKPVTGSLSLTGGDAGNYTVNASHTAAANITQRALVVTAAGVDRIYDGTTAATVDLGDNRVSGDSFTISHSAAFADKNVGNAKPVSVTGISLNGPDAGNYLPNTTAATSASITPRTLVVTAHGVDKVYDGTTDATVTLSDNRIAGDLLAAVFGAAAFADSNVGTAKPVSVSGIAVSGPDAPNYSHNASATTTANITARPLTVAADPKTKPFGALDPALTWQITGGSLVAGDAISGSLVRVPGEAVGAYPIQQGSLTAGGNYSLLYLGGNLTISAWYATGFYQPVAMTPGVWNTIKGGATVPLKFNLYTAAGGTELTSTSDASFALFRVGCTSAVEDPVDLDFYTSGGSSFRYDTVAGQFIQNWQSPKGGGLCYQVTMTSRDGVTKVSAFFKTK